MNKLIKLYKSLPQPENWKVWIAISLCVKTLFFVYFISLASSLPDNAYGFNWKGSWAKAGGDTDVCYINPIETLIKENHYHDDLKMPGYGFLYYVIRLLTEQKNAANILTIIQLILSGISVYLLSLISFVIFKNTKIFYITFFIYLFSIYVSVNDYVLMTESLTTSTLIISFFLLIKHLSNLRALPLFLSGIFLTWAIFLRPICFPILIIYLFYTIIFYFKSNLNIKKIIIALFYISSTFFFFDGIWLIRNYKTHNKIIPFQRSVYGYGVEKGWGGAMYDFIRSFGGDIEFWEPHSELVYFFPESFYFLEKEGLDTNFSMIPKFIYSKNLSKETLSSIRKQVIEFYNIDNTKTIEKKKAELSLISKIKDTQEIFKKERPFHYYITSRIRSVINFFRLRSNNISGLVYFDGTNYYYLNRLFNISNILLYYIVILGGLLSLIFLFIKNLFPFSNIRFLLISCGMYLIFANPLIFLFNPNRYLVTGFPFLVIFASYFLIKVIDLFFILSLHKYKGSQQFLLTKVLFLKNKRLFQ